MIGAILEVDARGQVAALESGQDELDRAARRAHKADGFLLCIVEDPDEAEMRELAERFRLHPLAAADAASGKQQPKIQNYPEHLFIVMWTLAADGRLQLGQVFLFVREGLLLCVQRGDERHRLDIADIVTDQALDVGTGAMSGAYRIMNRIAADYTKIESEIEDELEEIEAEVFDEHVHEDAAKIYRLRQRVGKVSRAVATFATALDAGRDHLEDLVVASEKLGPYLRDLRDDVAATATLAADQSRALDGIMSTHENNVATRQNADTRRISAFAALLALPAVIAGIYVMNFKTLPLVEWSFGWVVIAAVIVALDVVTYIVFKRRKWL